MAMKITPEAREQMNNLYGENHRVEGVYDQTLAVSVENGTYVGRKIDGVLSFKGIPYAKPPVGPLRWKRAEAPEKDRGCYEAYYFGPSPIQTELFSEYGSLYKQSEDCLYLNVWKGSEDAESRVNERRPVMVFFHGGSYGWGGTSDPLYDGSNFVRNHPDIIMVTVGYRTGILGFLDLSFVPRGEVYPDSANLGLLDQIEALRWIQRNIASFGGDPDNVTIFGESAGGGSASILPVMPEAKGLFVRSIAQSGSIALTFNQKECVNLTKRLMKKTGCKTAAQLAALSEEEIKKANKSLNDYNNFPMRDGIHIPFDLYEAYKRGDARDIEIISGTNADESRYWIRELGGIVPYMFMIPVLFDNNMLRLTGEDKKGAFKYLMKEKGFLGWRRTSFYTDLLFRVPMLKQSELHAGSGGKSYVYYWDQPSGLKYLGACHAVELAYVFENPECNVFTGDVFDSELSRKTADLWADFARGRQLEVQGEGGTIQWPLYEEGEKKSLKLAGKIEILKDNLAERRKLIEPLLRYRFNGYYAELSFRVPYIRRKVIELLILLAILGLIVWGIIRLING